MDFTKFEIFLTDNFDAFEFTKEKTIDTPIEEVLREIQEQKDTVIKSISNHISNHHDELLKVLDSTNILKTSQAQHNIM